MTRPRELKRPDFNADLPLIVMKPFNAVDKRLKLGDSFEWKEWRVPLRRVTQLWDLRYISNESDEILQYIEEMTMTAEVEERQEVATSPDGLNLGWVPEGILTQEEVNDLKPEDILSLNDEQLKALETASDEEVETIMANAVANNDLAKNAEILAKAQTVTSKGAKKDASV